MTDKTGQSLIDFSPATRTTHPVTSRIAEQTITKSGRRQRHCDIILNALYGRNGSTTKELAVVLEGILTHAQIWRRMNDLAENDEIYRNSVNKRDGYSTWWLRF